MYQPGGESEKAYILQYLVTPPKAQTVVEMVATLRQWERMLLRADNLSIAKPDPSLLVRGLNALVGDVWAKDRDVTFRTQLVKSRLGSGCESNVGICTTTPSTFEGGGGEHGSCSSNDNKASSGGRAKRSKASSFTV